MLDKVVQRNMMRFGNPGGILKDTPPREEWGIKMRKFLYKGGEDRGGGKGSGAKCLKMEGICIIKDWM